MQKRAHIIDFLRALAIIGMVLSGYTIANVDLPAWLFHAQLPPPNFSFDPSVAGITWVDLVFPFFLFSMGAAFPLALRRRAESGESSFGVFVSTLKRYVLLAFFAIALGNFRGPGMAVLPHLWWSAILVVVWALFWCCFVRLKSASKNLVRALRFVGFGGIALLVVILHFVYGVEFSLHRNDIILLILSAVVFFGTLVWWFTRDNLLIRLAILAFFIAFKVAMSTDAAWAHAVWNFTPVDWLFHFEFLTYLGILIPGTIAGDMIQKWLKSSENDTQPTNKIATYSSFILLIALFCINMWGLFEREIGVTIVATIAIGAVCLYLLRKGANATDRLHYQMFAWGLFWLLLGLLFEPFEGGVKKDPVTISYFLITSGLASTVITAASIAINYLGWSLRPFVECGQNPMVAYTVSGLFVVPVLALAHLSGPLWNLGLTTPWMGFVYGLIITLLMFVTTIFCTRKKFFWRT